MDVLHGQQIGNNIIFRFSVDDVKYIKQPVLWIRFNGAITRPKLHTLFSAVQVSESETIYPEMFPLLYTYIGEQVIQNSDWLYIPLPILSMWNDERLRTQSLSIILIDCHIPVNTMNIQIQTENIKDPIGLVRMCMTFLPMTITNRNIRYTIGTHYLLERHLLLSVPKNVQQTYFAITDMDGNMILNKRIFVKIRVKISIIINYIYNQKRMHK